MKNKITNIINWMLLFSLPVVLLTSNVKTDTIKSEVKTNNLATSLFTQVEEVQKVKEVEEKQEEETKKEEVEEQQQEQEVKQKEEVQATTPNVTATKEVEQPVIKEEKVEVATNSFKTYSGSMSYYKATCSGCSGITAAGFNVSDGRLYYNDSTYGNVRIIAAGSEIKTWSIVRIKNSSFGQDILAIVLDRGGNIGSGKKYLIDMLTNSSESRGGVENVTIEVLREGK